MIFTRGTLDGFLNVLLGSSSGSSDDEDAFKKDEDYDVIDSLRVELSRRWKLTSIIPAQHGMQVSE
jgi:hypothetical protein